MQNYKSTEKPRKCPSCGCNSIAEYCYGMPAYTEEFERDLKAGKIAVGGCVITGNDPAWVCNSCKIQIYKKIKFEIVKSPMHSKITGDLGERLVLYWLSKNGFECSYVDHTGIDLIARNPHTKELMGISVKSRSRNEGKEGTYLSIPNENIDKINRACEAYGCVPYFAIMVDEEDKIYIFILSKDHLLTMFPQKQTSIGWKMTKNHLDKYKADKEIKIIEFEYDIINWWN